VIVTTAAPIRGIVLFIFCLHQFKFVALILSQPHKSSKPYDLTWLAAFVDCFHSPQTSRIHDVM